MKLAETAYKTWKTRIRAFTNEHGFDLIPNEFVTRVHEWMWLKYHFHDPKYLVRI